MKVGYARTSTLEQVAGFEAQIDELGNQNCQKIYKEQVSSVEQRQELSQALDFLREGDTLVVTKLDRLARSMRHLGEIVETIRNKGAHLQILNLGVDTSNATGELVLNLLGAVSQFERQIMLERQREGIAKAKGEGKYKGRKATARAKTDKVLELKAQGASATAIAKDLGIGRASVYRILKKP
ncbi:recombinase family protein [Sneathiella sp. HT1-7]|uniref:recombinase family protein n=1 Tax=Sneathiella sp. HT1-7 TaxID=2887192 RepID=UPI001D15C647|nr:recombinase family protein [Sneathiella sp. HT1-7]MCC3306044.1 recombinase family protein [Sneathiella sp. HT1-7]